MFQFKQFTIHQDRTAMKVGTDGVLLGAWATLPPTATRILDIGTGTGLIALMIAQRRHNNNLQICAIDIDKDSIEQAAENISNSLFAQYISTQHTSLQEFSPNEKFDVIVCNPPYFVASLKCPDAARTQARHTDSLSFDDLLLHSARLLNTGGSLSVILPVQEGNLFINLAEKYGFAVSEIVDIHPTPTAPPKRLLIRLQIATPQSLNVSKSSLTIELARHQYTDEYIALTRDFYLKM